MPEKFPDNAPENDLKKNMKKVFHELFMPEETEEVKQLKEWVENRPRPEIEEKLNALQLELIKLQETGKIETRVVSTEEENLRQQIIVLDRYLNPNP